MSLGACCIKGVSHEGTPIGSIKSIGGVPTYVTLPSGEYNKKQALLFLPDVFGLELENSKLLADDFAKNGFATYIPDYLSGDAIGKDALNDGTYDLMAWIGKHGQSVTRPILDKVIEVLKSEGIEDFGATGYCFGGRYTMDLAISHVIKVGIVAHPSLLNVPEDFDAFKKAGTIPFLWNTCEKDFMFGPEKQALADEAFKGDANYKRDYYPGCEHGFAVRGDMSDEKVKAGKEGAFEATVKFLQAHL